MTIDQNSPLSSEDVGYHQSLKPRQLQMIAIGGAIGTGLFLGAGGRLASAGPGLFLAYGLCGVFVFVFQVSGSRYRILRISLILWAGIKEMHRYRWSWNSGEMKSWSLSFWTWAKISVLIQVNRVFQKYRSCQAVR